MSCTMTSTLSSAARMVSKRTAAAPTSAPRTAVARSAFTASSRHATVAHGAFLIPGQSAVVQRGWVGGCTVYRDTHHASIAALAIASPGVDRRNPIHGPYQIALRAACSQSLSGQADTVVPVPPSFVRLRGTSTESVRLGGWASAAAPAAGGASHAAGVLRAHGDIACHHRDHHRRCVPKRGGVCGMASSRAD
jgi:hypothetical protein